MLSALCQFLAARGFSPSTAIEPGQPFLVGVLEALLKVIGDPDSNLPLLLAEGVPTGFT